MIKEVTSFKDLKRFVHFVEDLYKDSKHYVYPLFGVLLKELKSEVLVKKKYKAILYIENEALKGRLLYTFEYNHKTDRFICYFSYFDAYNQQIVFNQLFAYMEADMRDNKIDYSEGSFTPYDPDNRRGVLVKGFEDDPVIFTSYNYPYYQSLFESYGYQKAHDTFSLQPPVSQDNKKRLKTISDYFIKRYDLDIKPINLKAVDSEIKDIHQIIKESTTALLYQEAPSIELINEVARNLKFFLEPKIILIAREKSTSKPVGFTLCLPDFNQLFKRTKGKMKPLYFLFNKKKITRSRGMLQYIIPKYQGTGLIGYMYKMIFDNFEKMGINEFEAGTMMEENLRSLKAFSKFGGEVVKIYRIYGKEI